ncbi:hypothetical protein P4654_10635 [Niallia taxi]|uniref:hypothetical protein n=1 Tax=Niallia taxi TaxID=2499688 RepID=UPI002E1DFB78|nr:hypothetical protein [Niallia taxi]MED4122007.1 hypothetical protein [Niallia taxi]
MTDKREQYDSRLEKIDEQICGLINKRKSIASKSSFPSPQLITSWSTKYDLYEDFLGGYFITYCMKTYLSHIQTQKDFVKISRY